MAFGISGLIAPLRREVDPILNRSDEFTGDGSHYAFYSS